MTTKEKLLTMNGYKQVSPIARDFRNEYGTIGEKVFFEDKQNLCSSSGREWIKVRDVERAITDWQEWPWAIDGMVPA
jgi:hypothetical protein